MLHVPLAASYPPGERLALEILLAAQIGSAAILSPMLCQTAGTVFVAAGSALPTLLLAGAMQMKPISSTVSAAIVVMCWLGMLWVWSATVSRSSRAVVAAIAFLIAMGPPLLSYLKAEFARDPEYVGSAIDSLLESTPTSVAWNLISEQQLHVRTVLVWVGIFGLVISLKLLRLRKSASHFSP
jgi:hypothetical protein